MTFSQRARAAELLEDFVCVHRRADSAGLASRLGLGPLNVLDTRIGPEGGGDVGQVLGVGDVNVQHDVEEIRLPMVHPQADDIAAGFGFLSYV